MSLSQACWDYGRGCAGAVGQFGTKQHLDTTEFLVCRHDFIYVFSEFQQYCVAFIVEILHASYEFFLSILGFWHSRKWGYALFSWGSHNKVL